jgi:hypothetical protein
MLAMKDAEGFIRCSLVGLADRAKISPEECRRALDELLSPDPDDSSGVLEGRRVVVVPGGWQIVNNELYRFSTEQRREIWRLQKARQREMKAARKAKESPFLPPPPAVEASLASNPVPASPSPPTPGNKPPSPEAAIAHFHDKFFPDEIRSTCLGFEADAKGGIWMWGKSPVANWQAAMARRMMDNRDRAKLREARANPAPGPAKMDPEEQNIARMTRESKRLFDRDMAELAALKKTIPPAGPPAPAG